MYSDAGTVYVNKLTYLIHALEKENQDILFSSSIFREGQWAKRDVFEAVGVNFDETKDLFQSEATFIFMKRTTKSLAFVDEWLRLSCYKTIITDSRNECGLPNASDFISNRHD